MSNKIMSSGELLSNLNKNIDKSHHKKPDNNPNILGQTQKSTANNNNNQIQVKDQNSQKISPKKQSQNPKQNKKSSSIQKTKNVQTTQLVSKQNKRDAKYQTQRSQSRSVRSNISKASQIRNRKSNFEQKFQDQNHLIQQQELGQTLHQILAMQIGKLISQPLAEVIQAYMKDRQNSIFIAYTQPEKNYLQNLIQIEKKKQDNCISEIQNLLAKRQNKTMQKLDKGQLFIDRERAITTKSQIQDLHKLDIARLVKIKEGAIRSKLDLLNDKIFQFQALQNSPKNSSQSLKKYQQEKLQELTDPNNFSLNSQKTKIAHDYVKYLQQQKLLLLKNMRQRQQKRSQQQKERQMQLKQAQQMRGAAKKQEIQQRIKQYKKKRQEQVSQEQDKSKKVQQFLKEYRKSLPLYKKKQKQFTQVYIKKKDKEIQQKLKAIRQDRRSLSLNEIKDHEQKYLQRKSLDQTKKQEQLKMMLKAKQATQSTKQYFKGFFHDKVKIIDQQERLKFYSLRQSTKIKIQRMTQFDQKIRKLHKPKVDPKKKQALQRIIQMQQLKKKKVKKAYKQVIDQNGQSRLEAYYEEIPQIDHYRQGNKYMQISKSLAKKKRPQQTSRYTQELQIDIDQLEKQQKQKIQQHKQKKIVDWQNPSPIISQQKDIWRLRSKQLHQMTDQISPQNFYQVKKNLQLMDDKAKMRQQLLKHKDSDAHQQMHQKSMLDEFYLESIKNKIKLLNE